MSHSYQEQSRNVVRPFVRRGSTHRGPFFCLPYRRQSSNHNVAVTGETLQHQNGPDQNAPSRLPSFQSRSRTDRRSTTTESWRGRNLEPFPPAPGGRWNRVPQGDDRQARGGVLHRSGCEPSGDFFSLRPCKNSFNPRINNRQGKNKHKNKQHDQSMGAGYQMVRRCYRKQKKDIDGKSDKNQRIEIVAYMKTDILGIAKDVHAAFVRVEGAFQNRCRIDQICYDQRSDRNTDSANQEKENIHVVKQLTFGHRENPSPT